MQAASLRACDSAAPVHPLRARSHRSTEVDLCWIARRLGLLGRHRRTIIERLRLLAEREQFPLPKTPRFVRGVRVTGPRAIDAFSIWDRDAVERWFEDDLPPPEAAAATASRRVAAAEEMGRRALELVVSR